MKNLNCRKAEEWIVTDLDEGLDHEQRMILKDHLLSCASCRKMREDTELLLSEVTGDAPEDPGETFWKLYRISLDARLRESDISRSRRFRWTRAWGFGWKPASVLATAILVFVVISIGVFHPWSFRPSMNEALSPQLIEELNQIYGPVSDELTYSALVAGNAQFSQASRLSVLDDSSVEWFEVEDEPDQFFL